MLWTLLMIAGCGLFGDERGRQQTDYDTASIEQSEACAWYIECLLAVAPDSVGEIIDSYGPDGACWDSQENADLCTQACEEATEGWWVQFPDEPACMPESRSSSKAIFGEESVWQWTSDTCMVYSDEVFWQTTFFGDDDYTFDVAIDIGLDDGTLFNEANTSCTLELLDLTCEPWVTSEVWYSTAELSFGGAFSSGTGSFYVYSPEVPHTWECDEYVGFPQ